MSLPPAQPAYILRGHAAQIHATSFIRSNQRLVTGDADGWVVVWSLATKRAVAVWKAHEGAILGAQEWGDERLITHGKDNKLIVWKFSENDESGLSTVLPVNGMTESRKQPWLLYVLEVNTMNFCSFAQCPATPSSTSKDELLIAVPNTLTSESVDIFHLPSTRRQHTVPGNPAIKGGMIMAVSISHHPTTHLLTVIAGYESGHAVVSQLAPTTGTWHLLYTAKAHTQPILSLALSPISTVLKLEEGKEDEPFFLTSSADATIAKHPIPILCLPAEPTNTIISPTTIPATPLKTLSTKHAGQQGLQIRDDGKVFATAGWDARVRVYSVRGMRELAVLKWHREGCYAVAFAAVGEGADGKGNQERDGEGGGKQVEKRTTTMMSVKEKRIWAATRTHWVAVGSKDGKVSLWDIY